MLKDRDQGSEIRDQIPDNPAITPPTEADKASPNLDLRFECGGDLKRIAFRTDRLTPDLCL
jgi:hypothetical protein